MSVPQKSPISVTLTFDPDEMSRRGRLGAHRRLALHDTRALTSAARAAFDAKFDDEVDPERLLPEDERRRRVAGARAEYFARLGRLSAKARQAKRAVGGAVPSTSGQVS